MAALAQRTAALSKCGDSKHTIAFLANNSVFENNDVLSTETISDRTIRESFGRHSFRSSACHQHKSELTMPAQVHGHRKAVQAAKEVAREDRRNSPLDSTIEIVTPENIAFNYQVAGPFRRLCAFLVDSAIIFGLWALYVIVMIIINMLLMFLGLSPTGGVMRTIGAILSGYLLILIVTSLWSYGALFESFWSGQTPGKWMLNIRTLSRDGQQVSGLQAVLRNILRGADAFPLLSPVIFAGTFIDDAFFWSDDSSITMLWNWTVIPTFLLGFISMMLTPRFQRIGDLVSGTMVVMEERSWLMGVAKVEDPRTAQLAALLPPKFQISRPLAKALATYVERRRFFSIPRRREIARHLGEPLLSQFGMPADTSHDLLLCALYYRVFVAETEGEHDASWNVDPYLHRAEAPAETGVTFVSASAPADVPATQNVTNQP